MSAVILICGTMTVASCSSEDNIVLSEDDVLPTETVKVDKNALMNQFAQTLSKVVRENQKVRELVKNEAIKQFDKNYDVLWIEACDKMAGDATFRELMVAKSSEEFMASVEQNVPLLNILFPKISMFDVSAENYDSSDEELPVVVSNDDFNALYFDGELTDSLEKGLVPSFNVLVVNENNRVVVDRLSRSATVGYAFIDSEFDNTASQMMTRRLSVDASVVGSKAIAAYGYFYKDDGSNESKALQRDYIYYGMTPTSTQGYFNQNVTEYLSFIEIDPKAYFLITDTKDKNKNTDDPEIKQSSASRKKRDFTTEELINEFWTRGCYNLRIELVTSTSTKPMVKYLALSPDDIWEFNLERHYRHGTLFRKKKFTYYIDVNKFTPKRYYLTSKNISFGKWNLSDESLSRDILFIEEDPGETYTEKYIFETINVDGSKVSGNVKFGLGKDANANSNTNQGAKNKVDVAISGENNSSTTEKITQEITISRTNKDDNLGMAKIYFYDPIIEGRSGSEYVTKVYNTGVVSFGVTAI